MNKPNFINPKNEDDLQWKTTSNGRRPPMRATSNGRQPAMEDNLQWKMSSKYHTGNISATTVWIVIYEFLGGY
jgi:hypothetical protein